MAIDNEIIDDFENECDKTMGFLVTEYGFSKEFETLPMLAHVTYCKRDVGILCSLDIRDEMISVYLTRLENGKVPKIYYRQGFVNDRDEVVQEYLSALLRGRGIDYTHYERNKIDTQDLSSQRQKDFRITLASSAYFLKEHAKDVLDGSAEIFATCPSRAESVRYSINAIKKQAAEAWEKRDYAKVLYIIGGLEWEGLLTEEEKARVEYAKKQISDTKSNTT